MRNLGINYTPRAGLTEAQALPLFHEVGFTSVFCVYAGTTEKTEPFADLAEQNSLKFESIHAPFSHINDIWYATEAGDRMEQEIIDTVKTAASFSVPYVVVHLSSGDHAPCVNDIGHARFDRIVECAVKNHVTIAFENQRKLANLAFVMELYENVPEVGFCWDVGHEQCFAYGREYMPIFGSRLVYTHIHDNYREHNGDVHMIPFDALIDYSRVVEHLKNFKGTLTLEVLPENSRGFYDGVAPEEYYRKAYRAAERLRTMLDGTL